MSNPAEATTLVHEALRILDRWKVLHQDQLSLLDLPADMHPRMLKRMRKGDSRTQETHDMLERIRCIFDIDRALQIMFPFNSDMADYWVTTPNLHLQERSPLDVMLARGHEGMQTVSQQLNGTDTW